ncbi:hypothetical protein Tco_0962630 [Tanacetum coccineum]
MALLLRDQRHQYLRFEGLEYTDADIKDFEERLGKIYGRGVHRVQGQSVFTSRAWRFGEAVLHLDTVGALQFQLGEAKRHPRQGGSECLLERISSEGDFLGTTSSYTMIRDQILRLCHRLIACNITGRSQAPKKVTVTDLFYLQGMDVDSVNIPYLLARYLRRFTLRRKSGAIISGALGPERQPNAAAGALKVAEGAPDVDEGAQAVPAPVQAPQPPPVGQGRTIPQRLARLEEEVYGFRGSMAEQRDMLDSMARDFSRFTTWTVTSLSLMMDQSRVRKIRRIRACTSQETMKNSSSICRIQKTSIRRIQDIVIKYSGRY